MDSAIQNIVVVAPNIWPGSELQVQPGDFRCIAPMGFGISGPAIMRPWDKPEAMMRTTDYYGYQQYTTDPYLNAPRTDYCGGTIYFDGEISKADVKTVMSVIGVRALDTKYAVFLGLAENPEQVGYLAQIRVMSTYALSSMFGAKVTEEHREYIEHDIAVGELVWAFLEDQRKIWGVGMSSKLYGTFGGDGDWAKEALCFGMMVENHYYGIFRVWSRARLVTK